MKRPRPTTRRPRPRPRRKEAPKESRHLSEARTRAAVEYVAMRLTKKGKWVPVTPNADGAERPPSWSKARRRTRTVEEVRELVRRELEDAEGDR